MTRGQPRWAGGVAVAAAAVTAASVTLVTLGSDSLSTNEAISYQIARLPWIPIPGVVTEREANMAVYYLLLHWWTILGQSELMIRGLSALAALATIPTVYGLAHRLFGARPAMIAAVVFGANPFVALHAHYARSYTLLMLLVTAASYSFVRGVQERSWRYWAAYCVCGALGIYTHFFAGLVLASHAVSLLFLPRREVPWRRLAASVAGMAVLLVPLLLFFLSRDVALIEWIKRPRLTALPGLLLDYSGSRTLLLAYGAAGAMALHRTVHLWRRRGIDVDAWGHALAWSWFLLPVASAFLVSYIRPVFVPRYLIVSLPPLVILVGAGLARLRLRWLVPATSALLVVSVPVAANAYKEQPEQEDFRAVTRHILANGTPDDAIFTYRPSGRTAIEYYLARQQVNGGVAPAIVYPPTPWERAAYKIPAAVSAYRVPPEPAISVVDRATGGHDRVWLVLSHGGYTGDPQSHLIQDQLASRYRHWREERFRGLRLRLYEQRR